MPSTAIDVNVASAKLPTTVVPSSTSMRVGSPAAKRSAIWLSSPSPLTTSTFATTFAVTAASATVAGTATAAATNKVPERDES